MSVIKHFVGESVKKAEIDEFLRNEFEKAGYGGVDITKTPLGTHVVIYAMRPGLIIGRGGETIKDLARVLEEKFQLSNPQISVAEIEVPEFNAYVIAARVTSALKRGVHFRRAGFWALNQVMEAGALGAEIIVSGKLRTDRARHEKFQAGYLPKSGDPAIKYIRRAELAVQLKPGIYGVKVRIVPPTADFPDRAQVFEEIPKVTEEKVTEEVETKPQPKKRETKGAKERAETAEAKETAETEEAKKTLKIGEAKE